MRAWGKGVVVLLFPTLSKAANTSADLGGKAAGRRAGLVCGVRPPRRWQAFQYASPLFSPLLMSFQVGAPA